MARTVTAVALLLALSCAFAVGVQAQTRTPSQRLATAVAELDRARAELARFSPKTAGPIIRVIDQALADIKSRSPRRLPKAVALTLRFPYLPLSVAPSVQKALNALNTLTSWPVLPPPPRPPPPPPRRPTIADIVTSASDSVSQAITVLADTTFSEKASLDGAVTNLSGVLTSLQSSIDKINNAIASLDLGDETQAQAEPSLREAADLLSKAP